MIVDDLTKLHANLTYLCASSGGSRTVRYIDIVEIPEGSAWTSPGDLIITTGYFLQSPADFERLVTRLIDNQVVGLGIKIGKYVHQIPDSVRELAEENRFPILSIPMELSYRDIQRILLHSREDGPSGAAQITERSDIVAFYSQVLLGGDRSLPGLKTLSERAGLSFRSDRLIFAAAMDPGTAKDAIDRLLLRPSPDFFCCMMSCVSKSSVFSRYAPALPQSRGFNMASSCFTATVIPAVPWVSASFPPRQPPFVRLMNTRASPWRSAAAARPESRFTATPITSNTPLSGKTWTATPFCRWWRNIYVR